MEKKGEVVDQLHIALHPFADQHCQCGERRRIDAHQPQKLLTRQKIQHGIGTDRLC